MSPYRTGDDPQEAPDAVVAIDPDDLEEIEDGEKTQPNPLERFRKSSHDRLTIVDED